jgi:hypothetical protein
MPTISLTNPTALTVIAAGLHSTNYSNIQSLLNGGLDNANVAPGANIALSKLSFPGGTTFLKADGTFANPVPTLVTSFPGSPANGEVILYTDSLTAPTYIWMLQYNSGISDSNKWVFIGGASIQAETQTDGGVESQDNISTYSNLTTTGPSITVPRTGVYYVEIGADAVTNGGSPTAFMSYSIGASAASDNDRVRLGGNTHSMRSKRKTLTASDALVAKYKNGSGNPGWITNYTNRWMRLTPVRVA